MLIFSLYAIVVQISRSECFDAIPSLLEEDPLFNAQPHGESEYHYLTNKYQYLTGEIYEEVYDT